MYCIKKCLELYKDKEELFIYSKSLYAVESINTWFKKWLEVKTLDAIEVQRQNVDLIKDITELVKNKNITIRHVHKKDKNIFSLNCQLLAKQKAQEYTF